MKNYLIALFVLLFISKTFAQTDQELVYATYFGGEDIEFIFDIAVDQQGNSYLVGRTKSETGISTSGSYQDFKNGGVDGFIAKFDSSYNLVWSTYFGGENFDVIYGTSVFSDGSIVIAGETTSESDISTIGAYQEELLGGGNAFISKFTSDGEIIWSTYFGGDPGEQALSVSIDSDDNIYIAGQSLSDGMATSGAYQENLGGDGTSDGILAKFSSTGDLIWSTYYGGELTDRIFDISVTSQNELILIGETKSETNIASEGAHQENYNGGNDSFIAKFTLTGERVWGTYYGGTGFEKAYTIDSDNQGNIIASGYSTSTTNIATPGAHKTIIEFDDDYLASFNSDGQINWGTYFGGVRRESEGNAVYVNGNDIYLSGRTDSEEGITLGSPYQTDYAGPYEVEYFNSDIYLTKFNSEGQQIWGTYYGGESSEIVSRIIMIDENTVVMAAGSGDSGSTIITPDALQTENAGLADGLFAVFDIDLLISVNEIEPSELNLYPNPTNNYFVIELPETINESGFVEIFTLEGKRLAVFENYISNNRISLDLVPGMYIVSYRTGDVDLRTKLIVK